MPIGAKRLDPSYQPSQPGSGQRSRSAFIVSGRRLLVADPVGSSPQEFAAYVRGEYDEYGKVIKATGARAE